MKLFEKLCPSGRNILLVLIMSLSLFGAASSFATQFVVTINPDAEYSNSHTFQLDWDGTYTGEQWSGGFGYSNTLGGPAFSFNCYYVEYGTYSITGNGTYDVTGGWMGQPVRIVVTGYNPETISITSASSVRGSSGTGFSYTITATSNFSPITYSAWNLPAGFSYDSTNHKVTTTFSDSYSERTFAFYVSADDGISTAQKQVTVTVSANQYAPSVTSSSSVNINHGDNLDYTISALGTSPINYGVSANVLSWFDSENHKVVSDNYTEVNDSSVVFTVTASNAGGSDSKEVTANREGRVEIALYNDTGDDGINPQGLSLTTGTNGTATFSITNSDILKVYTDAACTEEFDGNSRDLATQGFPSPLYLKAIAPVTDAKATISRNDIFDVSDEVTFDMEIDGPSIAGRILNGTFVSETDEDDPANLESNNEVIEFALTQGGFGIGELKFEMADTGPYTRFGEFYYDSACSQPVGSDPPYTVTLSGTPSGVLSDLATNGSMSLYLKPLAPTTNANSKLSYSYSDYESSDKVNFKINMTSVGITGYTSLTATEPVPDEDEEDPSVYQVSGPFKIVISRGQLAAGTVSLEVEASNTKDAAKIYANSDFTGDVTNGSVDLDNPSGDLAPLATNGSMTLYVMPQLQTDKLTISLKYANGGSDSDKLCIKVNSLGINITEYKLDWQTEVPEKVDPEDENQKKDGEKQTDEDNAESLIVPVYDGNAQNPAIVKLRLDNGSFTSGKITFSITGDKKIVKVYTDEQLTKPLENYEVTLTSPEGDLAALATGDPVYLYVKPIAPADKVTAKIEYSENASMLDIACFKICSECPCTGCVAGEDSNSANSVHYKLSLGSNSYGKSAGSIYITGEELTMGLVSPENMQFALLQGVTKTVTNNGDIVQSITLNTGVTRVEIGFTTAVYGTETYYTGSTLEFYDSSNNNFRTVTLTNNFTATDDGEGNYTFTVNSFETSNTLHLSSGDVTTSGKYEKPAEDTWKLTTNDEALEYLKTTISGTAKTQTRYIGSMTNPVTAETDVYTIYPWGDALIQHTDTETTTYEYYDDTATDGLKVGNIKKITYPKGNTVEYSYDAGGNLTETLENRGGNTYRTTYELFEIISINDVVSTIAIDSATGQFDYGTIGETDVLKLLGTKEITKQYCNDTLTSHSETISYQDYSAGPNQYTSYDDSATAYTTYTYYYSDKTDTVRYGKVQKVVRSDGTITLNDYVRSGSTETATSYSGEPNGTGDAVVNGTKAVTVSNENGSMVSSASYAIVNSVETQTNSTTALTSDQFGRATSTQYMDGTTSSCVYGCCGVTSETGRDGASTTYMYDNMQRLASTTRDGVTTLYTYDMAGNQTAVTVKDSAGTELTTTYTYTNGEMTSVTDPLNNTTTYSNNGDTVTYPNGSTSITQYTQGEVSGVSGTAVHPVTYSSGPNWRKTMPQDVTTYTDLLGRQYKTVYADGTYSETFYNAQGRPYKQVSPAGRIILTEYDSIGRVYRTAIDMDKDGTIDGDDEITQYAYSYSTRDSKTVAVTTVTRIVGSNQKVLSVTENAVDGLDSWTTVNGLTSHQATVYNGSGSITSTAEYPDGSKTVNTSSCGKVVTIQQYNTDDSLGNLITYGYDGFNRPVTLTETYDGQTINLTTYTYNANGQPLTVVTNGRTTSFAYNNMGRRTATTLPGSRTVNYTYHPTGEIATVDGADTYRQAYAYDSQGRMSTLTTYQTASSGQATTWGYNDRGFMTSKTYADSKSTTYGYNADGQLTSRIWARGVITAYSYDNAGRQTLIDYSDSTTDISYSYDWMGNPATVTDAAGTHTFTYDYATAGHPGLVSVTIPYIVNHTLQYGYDSTGRSTSMNLMNNTTPVTGAAYTYDVQGRVATVGDGANTATYAYKTGLNLLDSTTVNNGSTDVLTTTRNYDSYHRLLSTSSASPVSSVVRSYTYVLNDKDQRTRLTMADGSYWVYTYDDKGQVSSGIKYDSNDTAIPGQYFGYNYDGIGNRSWTKQGVFNLQIDYTANDVNQYTQIDTPGLFPVTGEADADTTVKIIRGDANAPGSTEQVINTARAGIYFKGLFQHVDNSAAAQTIPYTVYAIKEDTANNKQLVQKASGSYTVPKAEVNPTYDDDGNMLTMPQGATLWTYTWNGENRLIAAESSDKKLEFAYDYMGRRFSKKVYSGSTGNWTLDSEQKFIYDGWNCIAVYDGSDVLQKSYLWGLDVTGSLQGAGGVGGLLVVTEGANCYYPCYDGNGNVHAYFDGSGTEVAAYDYNPFGDMIAASGTNADDFAYRFSTKPLDSETGLYYYGYRYYIPILGRWLNRDPMGENGGINLYVFVHNNPIGNIDILGLSVPRTKNRHILKNYDLQQEIILFHRLINKVDEAVKKCIISPCAAFTYLMGKLYDWQYRSMDSSLKYTTSGKSIFWKQFLDRSITYFSDSNYIIARAGILTGAMRWDNSKWESPKWLADHGGGGIRRYDQGLKGGYIQDEGDVDTTGRHDHLLANALLEHWFHPVLPNFYPDDDSSSTDVKVNKFGRKLTKMYYDNKFFSGSDLTRTLFNFLCNESKIDVSHKGIVTDKTINWDPKGYRAWLFKSGK